MVICRIANDLLLLLCLVMNYYDAFNEASCLNTTHIRLFMFADNCEPRNSPRRTSTLWTSTPTTSPRRPTPSGARLSATGGATAAGIDKEEFL